MQCPDIANESKLDLEDYFRLLEHHDEQHITQQSILQFCSLVINEDNEYRLLELIFKYVKTHNSLLMVVLGFVGRFGSRSLFKLMIMRVDDRQYSLIEGLLKFMEKVAVTEGSYGAFVMILNASMISEVRLMFVLTIMREYYGSSGGIPLCCKILREHVSIGVDKAKILIEAVMEVFEITIKDITSKSDVVYDRIIQRLF